RCRRPFARSTRCVRSRSPPPDQGAADRNLSKEKIMAKLTTDELLDAFKELTLIELSEFVKKFEETFEVTAAAPVAVAGPAAAARRLRQPSAADRARRWNCAPPAAPACAPPWAVGWDRPDGSRASRRPCAPARAATGAVW